MTYLTGISLNTVYTVNESFLTHIHLFRSFYVAFPRQCFWGQSHTHRAVVISWANVEALPEECVQSHRDIPHDVALAVCGRLVNSLSLAPLLLTTVGELHCSRTWQLPCHVSEYDHRSLVTAEWCNPAVVVRLLCGCIWRWRLWGSACSCCCQWAAVRGASLRSLSGLERWKVVVRPPAICGFCFLQHSCVQTQKLSQPLCVNILCPIQVYFVALVNKSLPCFPAGDNEWVPQPDLKDDTYWSGSAPLCVGGCRARHQELKRDPCGDSSCCWLGYKSLCRGMTTTTVGWLKLAFDTC